MNLSDSQKWYWMGIILFLIFCVLANQNQDNWKNDFLDLLFKVCCFISLGIFILGKLGAIGSSEKLSGKLDGKIIITTEFIEINSERYLVKDIKKLNLIIKDFWDKYEHTGPYYVGPWYMAGINNKIEFKYMNKNIATQFRIDLEEEFNILKNIREELKKTIVNNI
ncbi:hypothetical protein [Pontimicrobium aquaticum]|uniref:Uncharacterized protein n=1 Tax=Pontimicrobium aquaticum TaxID=2565367 RepID=A0A4U0ESP5_9FLAO|nr:hypothetical protein [Pontimicrobium aquaticum]TJY34816.1 hypothetical protein E5167_10955 [Pontimicrobium aquaticum]